MGLIVTLILGIFILIGVLVIKITKNSKVVEQLSISIALGTMSTLVITELLPEVFETFKTDNILNTILIIFLFCFSVYLSVKLKFQNYKINIKELIRNYKTFG